MRPLDTKPTRHSVKERLSLSLLRVILLITCLLPLELHPVQSGMGSGLGHEIGSTLSYSSHSLEKTKRRGCVSYDFLA